MISNVGFKTESVKPRMTNSQQPSVRIVPMSFFSKLLKIDITKPASQSNSSKPSVRSVNMNIYEVLSKKIAAQLELEWSDLINELPDNARVNVGPISPLSAADGQWMRQLRPEDYNITLYTPPAHDRPVQLLLNDREKEIIASLAGNSWVDISAIKTVAKETRKPISSLRAAGVIIATACLESSSGKRANKYLLLGQINCAPTSSEVNTSVPLMNTLPYREEAVKIETDKARDRYLKSLSEIKRKSSRLPSSHALQQPLT